MAALHRATSASWDSVEWRCLHCRRASWQQHIPQSRWWWTSWCCSCCPTQTDASWNSWDGQRSLWWCGIIHSAAHACRGLCIWKVLRVVDLGLRRHSSASEVGDFSPQQLIADWGKSSSTCFCSSLKTLSLFLQTSDHELYWSDMCCCFCLFFLSLFPMDIIYCHVFWELQLDGFVDCCICCCCDMLALH